MRPPDLTFGEVMALDPRICTADESAEIKGALDDCDTQQRRAIAERFPCEFDEWMDELERGER